MFRMRALYRTPSKECIPSIVEFGGHGLTTVLPSMSQEVWHQSGSQGGARAQDIKNGWRKYDSNVLTVILLRYEIEKETEIGLLGGQNEKVSLKLWTIAGRGPFADWDINEQSSELRWQKREQEAIHSFSWYALHKIHEICHHVVGKRTKLAFKITADILKQTFYDKHNSGRCLLKPLLLKDLIKFEFHGKRWFMIIIEGPKEELGSFFFGGRLGDKTIRGSGTEFWNPNKVP